MTDIFVLSVSFSESENRQFVSHHENNLDAHASVYCTLLQYIGSVRRLFTDGRCLAIPQTRKLIVLTLFFIL